MDVANISTICPFACAEETGWGSRLIDALYDGYDSSWSNWLECIPFPWSVSSLKAVGWRLILGS
jgi:hypothetical protein